jgi:hypothetical protein
MRHFYRCQDTSGLTRGASDRGEVSGAFTWTFLMEEQTGREAAVRTALIAGIISVLAFAGYFSPRGSTPTVA